MTTIFRAEAVKKIMGKKLDDMCVQAVLGDPSVLDSEAARIRDYRRFLELVTDEMRDGLYYVGEIGELTDGMFRNMCAEAIEKNGSDAELVCDIVEAKAFRGFSKFLTDELKEEED